jgi:hypothetical protein
MRAMVPNAISIPLNDDEFDALMQQDLSNEVGFQRLMATLQDNTDRRTKILVLPVRLFNKICGLRANGLGLFLAQWARRISWAEHRKRLLWVGRDRTEKSFETFFEKFGAEFCADIGFLCWDMWKPYLNAAARWAPAAPRILDRFHIVKELNEAIESLLERPPSKGLDSNLPLGGIFWFDRRQLLGVRPPNQE